MVFDISRTGSHNTEYGGVADAVSTNLCPRKGEHIVNIAEVLTVDQTTAALHLAVVFVMSDRIVVRSVVLRGNGCQFRIFVARSKFVQHVFPVVHPPNAVRITCNGIGEFKRFDFGSFEFTYVTVIPHIESMTL